MHVSWKSMKKKNVHMMKSQQHLGFELQADRIWILQSVFQTGYALYLLTPWVWSLTTIKLAYIKPKQIATLRFLLIMVKSHWIFSHLLSIHLLADQYFAGLLRMVPTFVSAHTFCASRKAWFKRHARAGLTLTQSTRLPSTWLKWKGNFSTVTKSSLWTCT